MKSMWKTLSEKLGIMQVPWILEWNLWLNTNYSRFQIQLISELNQHFCHWWLNIFVSITKWNSCGWWKFWFIKLSPKSKIQICKVLMMSICSKFIPSLSNNQLMTTYLLKKARFCFLSIGLGTECWQDLKSVVNYMRPITNSSWWLSIFYCTDKQLLLILTLYSVEWHLPHFFQAFLLVWQIFLTTR